MAGLNAPQKEVNLEIPPKFGCGRGACQLAFSSGPREGEKSTAGVLYHLLRKRAYPPSRRGSFPRTAERGSCKSCGEKELFNCNVKVKGLTFRKGLVSSVLVLAGGERRNRHLPGIGTSTGRQFYPIQLGETAEGSRRNQNPQAVNKKERSPVSVAWLWQRQTIHVRKLHFHDAKQKGHRGAARARR